MIKKSAFILMMSVFSILISVVFISISPASANTYDIYVNADNASGIEDGTEAHPYNTIAEATAAVLLNNKNNRKIYVAEGEYEEQVILEKYTKLYGEENDRTIIKGGNSGTVVKMKDHTKLKDVKVVGGNTGILVNKGVKAKIDKVKVTKTDKIGIEILKSERNDKEKVTVNDSKIYNNDGKGFYIKEGKIELLDNEIYDNDEEGIDLRSWVKGKIKSNEIYDNDESGIELIVGKAILKISRNKIKKNESSGITLQYYRKYGESRKPGYIVMAKNRLNKNDKYGLSCNTPSNSLPPAAYWRMSTSLMENIFEGNKLGNYDPICHLN